MSMQPNNQGSLASQGAGGAVPQGAPADDGRELTQGTEAATPEEQDAYERIVLAGDEILFGSSEAREALVKKMTLDAPKPAEALANATALLVLKLDEQSGGQIPEAIILPVAAELLEHVGELAESLKLFPIDEAVGNHAAQLMVGHLAEAYGMTEEEIAGMVNSVPPEAQQQIAREQGEYALKQPPTEAL